MLAQRGGLWAAGGVCATVVILYPVVLINSHGLCFVLPAVSQSDLASGFDHFRNDGNGLKEKSGFKNSHAVKILAFLFGCGFWWRPALVTRVFRYLRVTDTGSKDKWSWIPLLFVRSSPRLPYDFLRKKLCSIFNFAAFNIVFQCVRFLWRSVCADLRITVEKGCFLGQTRRPATLLFLL